MTKDFSSNLLEIQLAHASDGFLRWKTSLKGDLSDRVFLPASTDNSYLSSLVSFSKVDSSKEGLYLFDDLYGLA